MELTNLLFCVCFAWKANSEPDLQGYRLYGGTNVTEFRALWEGNKTNTCVEIPAGTKYFQLTAVDSLQRESLPTETLVYSPTIVECVTERSLDGVQWEVVSTNYFPTAWPVEFFRLRVERRQL